MNSCLIHENDEVPLDLISDSLHFLFLRLGNRKTCLINYEATKGPFNQLFESIFSAEPLNRITKVLPKTTTDLLDGRAVFRPGKNDTLTCSAVTTSSNRIQGWNKPANFPFPWVQLDLLTLQAKNFKERVQFFLRSDLGIMHGRHFETVDQSLVVSSRFCPARLRVTSLRYFCHSNAEYCLVFVYMKFIIKLNHCKCVYCHVKL